MTGEDAALLTTLPAWAFAFVLVVARVGAAMSLLPGLGEAEPPMMVRVGLALAITILLLPGLAPSIPNVPEASIQAALMVAAEIITGLWLGWLARLLVLALPIAGQFISYMLGIANVLQPDPELGSQATPLERMFDIGAAVAILASGLYALPLMALAGSYRLVPPGTLLPAADTAQAAVRAASVSFALACAWPHRSCWFRSSGMLARDCWPGWSLACRSISWPCLARSWEGLRCSPSPRGLCWPPGKEPCRQASTCCRGTELAWQASRHRTTERKPQHRDGCKRHARKDTSQSHAS